MEHQAAQHQQVVKTLIRSRSTWPSDARDYNLTLFLFIFQYVSIEGIENSNARAIVVKGINVLLTLLQVISSS